MCSWPANPLSEGVSILYMVVTTHNPESCAFACEESRQKARSMGSRMEKVTKAHGISVQGAWANMAAHMNFMLFEAPSPHAIDDALRELDFITWNTTTIYHVVPIQQAIESLPK